MGRRALGAPAKEILALDLVDHLAGKGRKVIIVCELPTGRSRNLKNLKNLLNLELTKFVLGIPPQMYHMACPTREQYEDDPIQALESCFMGTKKMLDVALRCNARVLLRTDSSSEQVPYEQSTQATWDSRLRQKRKRSPETDEVVKPVARRRRTRKMSSPAMLTSFYDEGNRLVEMLCSAYEQHFGLEVHIARCPEASHRPSSRGNDGSGRVLELITPAEDAMMDTTDPTLVDSNVQDKVICGLVNLMETPGPAKALTNKASQSEAFMSVA